MRVRQPGRDAGGAQQRQPDARTHRPTRPAMGPARALRARVARLEAALQLQRGAAGRRHPRGVSPPRHPLQIPVRQPRPGASMQPGGCLSPPLPHPCVHPLLLPAGGSRLPPPSRRCVASATPSRMRGTWCAPAAAARRRSWWTAATPWRYAPPRRASSCSATCRCGGCGPHCRCPHPPPATVRKLRWLLVARGYTQMLGLFR